MKALKSRLCAIVGRKVPPATLRAGLIESHFAAMERAWRDLDNARALGSVGREAAAYQTLGRQFLLMRAALNGPAPPGSA